MKDNNNFRLKKTVKAWESRRVHGICLVISIIIAAALTVWVTMQRGLLVEARTDQAKAGLAEQVLRFHVLADSDSERDQQVKMQVKSAVIAYLQEELGEECGLEDTKEFVRMHLDEITRLAQQTVWQENSSDTVTVELTEDEFPEKNYGDVTFPAGTYEALRLRIGSGNGHNWWCCLYPNLCFTDAVGGAVVPEEDRKSVV